MLRDVVRVEPAGNYRLKLRFDDDVEGGGGAGALLLDDDGACELEDDDGGGGGGGAFELDELVQAKPMTRPIPMPTA